MTDGGTVPAPRLAARRIAAQALAGLVVYVAVDIALSILRPGLSVLHYAESDYGNGPYSWLMDMNFVIRFLASAAALTAMSTALPLARLGRAGLSLLAVWAIGSGLLAFFPDDLPGHAVTAHGVVHLLAAQVGFVSCLAGTILLTIEFRRHPAVRGLVRPLAVICAVAVLSLLTLGGSGFGPHRLGGLYERLFIGSELLWLGGVSASLARKPAPPAAAAPAAAAADAPG